MGRGASPAETQLLRAVIAVAVGLVFALCVLRPLCNDPSVRTALPELRALGGIPTLVI
jgi:hypothetical protein